jgi:tetratricopeptide (TPR) repeat protein
MRAFVFTDTSLARHAGRFVWLAIDSEKAKNAPFRKRYQVRALPTFYILDPADGKVAVKWVGSMTVPQLERMLEDGMLAVARRAEARGEGLAVMPARAFAPADELLARADSVSGEGADSAAVELYRAALVQAPADWAARPRAIESLLFALSQTDQADSCVALARRSLVRLRRDASGLNVAASGLDCALALPADRSGRAAAVAELETATRSLVADTSFRVAADDRSGVYTILYSARKDAKDEEGARRTAREWAAFLEAEAERARTPDERAVFDSHRLSAYLELGEPERAIPMLTASERDLPDDYNPPARLAVAYKAMKRWDDALAASDRALKKAYGPRTLGMLQVRADIYTGKGDPAAARRTLEEALRMAEALPPGQRSEGTIAALRKKLAANP